MNSPVTKNDYKDDDKNNNMKRKLDDDQEVSMKKTKLDASIFDNAEQLWFEDPQKAFDTYANGTTEEDKLCLSYLCASDPKRCNERNIDMVDVLSTCESPLKYIAFAWACTTMLLTQCFDTFEKMLEIVNDPEREKTFRSYLYVFIFSLKKLYVWKNIKRKYYVENIVVKRVKQETKRMREIKSRMLVDMMMEAKQKFNHLKLLQ